MVINGSYQSCAPELSDRKLLDFAEYVEEQERVWSGCLVRKLLFCCFSCLIWYFLIHFKTMFWKIKCYFDNAVFSANMFSRYIYIFLLNLGFGISFTSSKKLKKNNKKKQKKKKNNKKQYFRTRFPKLESCNPFLKHIFISCRIKFLIILTHTKYARVCIFIILHIDTAVILLNIRVKLYLYVFNPIYYM